MPPLLFPRASSATTTQPSVCAPARTATATRTAARRRPTRPAPDWSAMWRTSTTTAREDRPTPSCVARTRPTAYRPLTKGSSTFHCELDSDCYGDFPSYSWRGCWSDDYEEGRYANFTGCEVLTHFTPSRKTTNESFLRRGSTACSEPAETIRSASAREISATTSRFQIR